MNKKRFGLCTSVKFVVPSRKLDKLDRVLEGVLRIPLRTGFEAIKLKFLKE